MIITITGGSASGKSALAEKILQRMPGIRYYAATMHRAFDDETTERINRHVKMREGKGFITVEQETGLDKIVVGKESSVMVECMSNLLANEMYLNKRPDAASCILEQIRILAGMCRNLIIVTNEIASDGMEYDKFSMQFIENMEEINEGLGQMSDYVMEAVYSIPVFLKGTLDELKGTLDELKENLNEKQY